jgi:hypothetical protein
VKVEDHIQIHLRQHQWRLDMPEGLLQEIGD